MRDGRAWCMACGRRRPPRIRCSSTATTTTAFSARVRRRPAALQLHEARRRPGTPRLCAPGAHVPLYASPPTLSSPEPVCGASRGGAPPDCVRQGRPDAGLLGHSRHGTHVVQHAGPRPCLLGVCVGARSSSPGATCLPGRCHAQNPSTQKTLAASLVQVRCVQIAIDNPAARGEFRVFNQFTEQFRCAGSGRLGDGFEETDERHRRLHRSLRRPGLWLPCRPAWGAWIAGAGESLAAAPQRDPSSARATCTPQRERPGADCEAGGRQAWPRRSGMSWFAAGARAGAGRTALACSRFPGAAEGTASPACLCSCTLNPETCL